MTDEEARRAVLEALGEVAPEIEPGEIAPDASFRDQIDIDSVDFLNFVIALHEETGIEIPEADYSKLATLDDAAAYLVDHAAK